MSAGLCRITAVTLYFLPVTTRVPLKFGLETLTSVTCARVRMTIADDQGRVATGWGETPLSVQWVWPGALPYEHRHERLKAFCRRLATAWVDQGSFSHPLEAGYRFQEEVLPSLLSAECPDGCQPIPWLAGLVCTSPFDLALHDAFGQLVSRAIYSLYGREFLQHDLSSYLESAQGSKARFQGHFPSDYLVAAPPVQLRAWHLVGGLDPLEPGEAGPNAPNDGHPVLLEDWIRRDGLKCLKVKLRGNDYRWDFERLVRVGQIAIKSGVDWLSADFNCTVGSVDYVNEMLDRFRDEQPRAYGMVLYVEQPFPYELQDHPLDVHSVAARKPLFLDESAHDWRMVRFGRELGWTGVALKTCKTQTGALLSACWAKAHGMTLMVQDLTNPMLAQIPHVLLAAHVGTIMGVETNAMQFYPAASGEEERVHPRLYQRRGGMIDLSTVHGPGFGYRVDEIRRELPAPDLEL